MFRRLVVDPMKQGMGLQRWGPWRSAYWTLRQKLVDRATNRRWARSSPRIVIVSEPSDNRHVYWHFLDWLARERPRLRSHIQVDRLPSRLPPRAALLHAWVPDPVIERAPAVYAILLELEAECAGRGVVVVHPARVLSHTKRDVFPELASRASVRTPRVVLVDEGFYPGRGGLELPILVRRRWGHGGEMVRLESEASCRQWWDRARTEPRAWVAMEYVEVRSEDGCYRKYRYFMAGSRGTPRHLIVSPRWEVRPADRVRTPATRAEELAFVGAPCRHHALFDALRVALEFEIVAIDYSYDADGGLVVWEVNPLPDLSRPQGEVGEYLAATVERSYAILADFYAERAGI